MICIGSSPAVSDDGAPGCTPATVAPEVMSGVIAMLAGTFGYELAARIIPCCMPGSRRAPDADSSLR